MASGLAAAQLIAVRSLHCHIGIIAMRFLLDACQAFIGHIVIWILLAILSFGFYWSYCHLDFIGHIVIWF